MPHFNLLGRSCWCNQPLVKVELGLGVHISGPADRAALAALILDMAGPSGLLEVLLHDANIITDFLVLSRSYWNISYSGHFQL